MFRFKGMGILVLVALLLLVSGESLSQPGGTVVLTATLSNSQAIPGGVAGTPAAGIGSAAMLFDPADNTLSVAVAYSGLSGPATLAHFHGAPAGATGGVVQTLCGAPPPALLAAGDCPSAGNSGFLQGTWAVPDDQVAALLSGQLYINIHTGLNGAGEIRGQVFPQ